jgi:hypothetical protein
MKSREAARIPSYIRRTIYVMLPALLGRARVLEVARIIANALNGGSRWTVRSSRIDRRTLVASFSRGLQYHVILMDVYN